MTKGRSGLKGGKKQRLFGGESLERRRTKPDYQSPARAPENKAGSKDLKAKHWNYQRSKNGDLWAKGGLHFFWV